MGRTHMLMGAAGFLGAVEAVQLFTGTGSLGIGEVLLGVATCAGGALLPDLDHKSTTAAITFGPVTKILAIGIAKVSGGHRHATHSFLAVVIFGLIAALFTHVGGLPLMLFLALLIGAGMRALRLKPFKQEHLLGLGNLLSSSAVAFLVMQLGVHMTVVPWAVAFGAYLHILGDSCTDTGCPVFWPFTPERFAVLPEKWRWSTGDDDKKSFPVEKALAAAFAMVAVCCTIHLVVMPELMQHRVHTTGPRAAGATVVSER